MKCIYCKQIYQAQMIGGLIYIYCCDKTQILASSLRPLVLKTFREDQGVVLVNEYYAIPPSLQEQKLYN